MEARLNPYVPPAEVGQDSQKPKPDVLVRVLAGILAMAGVIYLPVAFFFVFAPGVVIWLGWARIACGDDEFNQYGFWVLSMLWNGGWLAFFGFSQFHGEVGEAPLLLIHSLVAVVFSGIALRHQVGPIVFYAR